MPGEKTGGGRGRRKAATSLYLLYVLMCEECHWAAAYFSLSYEYDSIIFLQVPVSSHGSSMVLTMHTARSAKPCVCVL